MNLTALIITAFCLQASAYVNSQTVTLKVKDASLESIFKSIKRQTSFTFFYKEDLLDKGSKVTLHLKDVPIEKALQSCFKNQPFTYSIEGRIITIEPSESVSPAGEAAPRLVLETPPITVRGRIVNENGEPMIASVIIKGTNKGTTSNANGEFELNNIDEDAILIISATNIETITIVVNGQSFLNIPVKTSASSLNEVVVNKGYYSESRRVSTGNVARVTAAEIEQQPVTNPLQALQGRVAGVYINQNTGLAGGSINISIRGQNTLRPANETPNGNLPLYVVDGVPFTSAPIDRSGDFFSAPFVNANPLSSINPSDIENITILKDADATAIYGSRGSNGVVLITTKRGKKGKTTADIDISYGAGKVSRMMKLLNTRQYLDMRYEAFANENQDINNLFPSFFPDVKIFDTTKYTDWQKEIIGGTSNVVNVRAGLSGGNATTQFLFALQYNKETTVFPGNFNFTRGAGNLNVNHRSMDNRLSADFSINFNAINNLLPPVDLTQWAVLTAPVAPPLYDSTGAFNWLGGNYQNNFANLADKHQTKTQNLVTSANINYLIADGLKLGVRSGFTKMELNQVLTDKIASKFPSPFTVGQANFSTSSIQGWIVEPQLSYEKIFGKSKLSFLLGTSIQHEITQGQNLNAYNYTTDALIENVLAAPSSNIYSVGFSEYRYNAGYARFNYNYSNKYLLNLTARRDGSSRFGPNKQFGNFGAVGAGWIFTEEEFFSKLHSVINYGKLRGSYGLTGNDRIPPYGYLDSYTSAQYPYQGGTALVPTIIPNPDYSWETNKKLEIGLELGFLGDRLFLSTSYYQNRASNQLVGLSLAQITGATSIQYNLPAILQNSGWEFEISSQNIHSRKLSWRSSLNISIPNSKLISFPGIENTSYNENYVLGQPLYVGRGYHYLGVNTQTGLYDFEDTDKDGSFSKSDYVPIQKPHQIFFGGVSNTISFGGFELDFLFQFVKQTGTNYKVPFNNVPGVYDVFDGGPANQPVDVMSRWKKDGDISNVQKFTSSFFGGDVLTAWDYFRTSDGQYADASFVRLKNLSLSYNLPLIFIKKIKSQKAQVFIHAQNLLTISDYIGDPETQQPLSLPVLRMITGGVKLTF